MELEEKEKLTAKQERKMKLIKMKIRHCRSKKEDAEDMIDEYMKEKETVVKKIDNLEPQSKDEDEDNPEDNIIIQNIEKINDQVSISDGTSSSAS